MRYKTLGPYSRSAGAVYLDRSRRLAELRDAASRAQARIPAIRRIVLFGSMATGDATPRSDADLLVEVSASPYAHHRDRVPEILGAFRPLPCPLDIVVFTSEELSRPWGVARTALEQGTDLLDRPL